MRFVLYVSVIGWVVLAAVSSVDIGATARLFAKIHLGRRITPRTAHCRSAKGRAA